MAGILQGLFGGKKQPAPDDDFADFAAAPEPAPASILPVTPAPGAQGAAPTGTPGTPLAYTKWYRVWERTERKDWIAEAVILPFILLICILHFWGRRKNQARAKSWFATHVPRLEKEYAQVGFAKPKTAAPMAEAEGASLADASLAPMIIVPEGVMKEKTPQEFTSYATGRQNVAFTDIRVILYKRFSPIIWLFEYLFSSVFESVKTPVEKVELITYPFDGCEKDLVSPVTRKEQDAVVEATSKGNGSGYDSFVFAIVNKELMKNLRDNRYDLSLTSTKDHAKLPTWAAVMSESAEISDTLITQELVKALAEAGDAFRYLIITDQPLDKPKSEEDAKSRKRISLCLELPSGTSSNSYESTFPVFDLFLRLPDKLAASAHFRSEVTRKIRITREEELKKINKAEVEEQEKDRQKDVEKKKKEMRDEKLRSMSADEQRKYLEKEREKMGRKQQKRHSARA